ncbi:glycosyl transferase group 1 [Solidesulfovibrio carbinoliphilus subsp. oakridgensis]|uniref:Glycosyl transferase group 1 n=1 Tax=Solidesulfovibrio carbinoliphilus subsp. oakridgensis TaxID=694327 RepID=G7QCH7_9BACT|nr:glycosyltransferase family 4 protein [Solidesulfovibrio carbinoliphilus]EHJ46133.1 glycosyl transferase group 1 [Solidesulfovibrio carbinoliphilus subsp. oakridgensis]
MAMHIAFVAREAAGPGGPGQAGGIGRYAATLAAGLAARGARVALVGQSPDATFRVQDAGGLRLAWLPKWEDASGLSWRLRRMEEAFLRTRPGRALWADLAGKVRRALLVNRWLPRLEEAWGEAFDVVEFAECGAEGLFYLRRRNRPPCAVRIHCPTQLLIEKNFDRVAPGKRLLVRLERLAARRADAVTAPGSSAADLAAGAWRLAATEPAVLPNLYDGNIFSPATEEGRAGAFTIFYSGRLERLKGLPHFPGILSRLAARGVDFRVRLAGGDTATAPGQTSMKAWLLAALEPAVRERVTFLGHLGEGALVAELRAATVGLFLSAYETFGYTALEAQACGLPVIVSRTGGLAEVAVDGETGFLVDPNDHEAVAAGLLRLAGDRELGRRMGEAAARHAARTFSVASRSGAFLDFYAAVAAAAGSRRKAPATRIAGPTAGEEA